MDEGRKHGEQYHSDRKNKGSWIQWYCRQPGNIFFCEVSKDFILDNFNLCDLKILFTSESEYKEALAVILDEASIRKNNVERNCEHAKHLYGLIHARYIKSPAGLEAMRSKYVRGDFGVCPRHFCREQLVLPMGLTEVAGQDVAKMFCPKCQDVYSCVHSHLDSAFFGPTFPHFFYMTFEGLVPQLPDPASDVYEPRVFGFRVHASSSSLPKERRRNPEDGLRPSSKPNNCLEAAAANTASICNSRNEINISNVGNKHSLLFDDEEEDEQKALLFRNFPPAKRVKKVNSN